jgi:hypothetical protein
MAKTEKLSLRGIVREIERVQSLLSKVKATTPKGKKALALAIKDLRSIRKVTAEKCRGVFTVRVVSMARKRKA